MGMREHIREAPANKSQGYLPGIANKTHRYVAIIEGFNHSLKRVSKDYKETMLDEELRGTSSNSYETITYQRRNILIYYCVYMIPISIIYT
jgi:hypothetical protein